MMRALKIFKSVNLKPIVCLCDLAIYAKAIELKWKDHEKFNSCILMMGMFHMLMISMPILSKRFADTGVRDFEGALCGKMYNKGVRMYKLMYEAIMRKLFDSI